MESFTAPEQVNQRRYEALRAYHVDGLSYAEAGARFGYTRWTMVNLVRDYRAGELELFAPPRRPGPPPGTAPAKERVRGRVVALRRHGLSVYEISTRLAAEGTPLNRTSVGQILTEEGFGRLLRHPEPEASISPGTAGRDTQLPRSATLDFAAWPQRVHSRMAGLLLAIPDLVALDLPDLARRAGYPGTRVIGATSWLLSLLALKLTATRRVSHVDDLLLVDPAALERHYVPTRSQRARSVLTFFAQDSGTHNLVYANADIAKATQNREAIAFCDHWKTVSGADPHMLVMDQKVSTHAVLGELHTRGVKFLTLRMRSTALMAHINTLAPGDYKTITLDRAGRHTKPRVHESTGVKLRDYPGTVRQLIITGLGRDAPTVIITNDYTSTAKQLIERYARRMGIEQRLAEIIRAFHADALSSAVNLNVDLDIALCVLAQALLAALGARLPGYAAVTPDTLQRRFLQTPGEIITNGDTITVRLDRRAYTPVLRQAALPTATPVPWWGNRTLRYEYA